MRTQVLLGLVLGVVAGCGGGADAEVAAGRTAAEPAEPAARAPRVEAVARSVDYSSDDLKTVEYRYVDGIALRTSGGPAVLLTTTPVDACTRLAVLSRGSDGFSSFASEDAPALVLVRNEEYPRGNVELVQPGVGIQLAAEIAGLDVDGDRFVARGEQPGFEASDAPVVAYDVDLPYASLSAFDPLAADAGPEAAWLRGLVAQADADAEATVTATFLENEEDWASYSSRSTWYDLLANWEDFSVIAAASGPDCATLLVQAPGFAGGSRSALLRASGAGDQRKVFFAESFDDPEAEHYVVGRIEHPAFGAFPILDARAETVPGTGTVAIFSERPIGDASWDQLVQKQRAMRAVASVSYGTGYMLQSLEFAGPGMPVQSVAADTISNAYMDETSMAGLIKQGEPGQPRVVANFRLPLATPPAAAP